MSIWSALRPAIFSSRNYVSGAVSKRTMSEHNLFPIQPSRWHWKKFKDYLHFYVMIGVIPATAIVAFSNIFIGPATLAEIPKGCEPEHWEYYRHPITRFIARYIVANPQEDYEKYCHHLYEEAEKIKIRQLEGEIKKMIAERHDYQAYYYRPILAKYHRISKETADKMEDLRGD